MSYRRNDDAIPLDVEPSTAGASGGRDLEGKGNGHVGVQEL